MLLDFAQGSVSTLHYFWLSILAKLVIFFGIGSFGHFGEIGHFGVVFGEIDSFCESSEIGNFGGFDQIGRVFAKLVIWVI